MAQDAYVGRVRSLVTHTLLALFSLGIYAVVWYYLIQHELRKHEGRGLHPVLAVVLFLLVPVLAWFVMPFLTGRQLLRIQRAADADTRSSPWYPALWGLVPIVGWSIMAATLQAGANRAWLGLHRDYSRATQRKLLECPDCTFRFERVLHPFHPQPVQCPSCRRAGEI